MLIKEGVRMREGAKLDKEYGVYSKKFLSKHCKVVSLYKA